MIYYTVRKMSTKEYLEGKERETRQVSRLSKKVLKLFPELGIKEIEVRYQPSLDSVYSALKCKYNPINGAVVSVTLELDVGRIFFEYNKKQQKALIAHEIAHFPLECKYTKYFTHIIRRKLRRLQLRGLMKPKYNIHRLKRWRLMHELYADNTVIEKGLGKPLLKLLENIPSEFKLTEFGKEESKARIANLKERLK